MFYLNFTKIFILFFSVFVMFHFIFGMNPTVIFANPEFAKETQMLLEWLQQNRDKKTGLPYSHVGDERFENWSFTYDAALTALAYTSMGELDDAKRILDFYILNNEIWRLGGVIEACIPGEDVIGKEWSVRSGGNIWLGIASFHLYKQTGVRKYLNLSYRLAQFLLDLQNMDEESNNYGGIPLGPKGDPTKRGDQHFDYNIKKPSFDSVYSTEVIIEAYAFFDFLYRETEGEKYKKAQEACLAWLEKNGYQPGQPYLNRGYKDNFVATNVQSGAISALGVSILNSFEENLADKIITFIEKNCVHTVAFEKGDGQKVTVRGVDFIDQELAEIIGRPLMVSPEWTFQFANAYYRLEQDYMHKEKWSSVNRYMHKRNQLLKEMLKLAVCQNGTLAYPYATLPDTFIGYEIRSPRQGTLSTSGVVYGIMALRGFDPLR